MLPRRAHESIEQTTRVAFPKSISSNTIPMSYLEKLFPSTSLNSNMPPTRTSSNPNTQKRAPFKAPSRVATGDKPTKTTKTEAPAASKAKSGFQSAKAIELSDDAESDDGQSEDEVALRQPVKSKAKGKAPARARKEKDSDIDMDSDTVSEDETPVPPPARKVTKERALDPAMPIPPKLLTRILWEGFEDKDMKIGKEAMSVVGKYVETFVREAVARAIFERGGVGGEDELGDGFLQVRISLSSASSTVVNIHRSRTWRNSHRSYCWISEGHENTLNCPITVGLYTGRRLIVVVWSHLTEFGYEITSIDAWCASRMQQPRRLGEPDQP